MRGSTTYAVTFPSKFSSASNVPVWGPHMLSVKLFGTAWTTCPQTPVVPGPVP